jgi:chromosome partitioning protein
VEGLTFEALPAALKLPEYARKGAGYEVVIMDGPPRLGDVSEALAVLADLALIPVLPGMHDWNALADTWDRLDRADQIRAHLKRPRPPVARVLLLNRACEGTTVYRHAREALAKVTGASLAPVAVHHAPQALANMQGGECVFLDYPGSSAAAELARLADLYLPTRPAGLAAAGGAR